ncbi:MAG TPA: BamA/TamA family outer membrane protein, partial [Burkholderiales bacterium]|nr:BamA/TamA family outer membrane protein [Burkholderiales bacterium]
LTDGRKYFFARPVTFAFRGMHYGRYGSGADDARLTPLYVGNDQFVRGYSLYSFTADECGASGSSDSCPAFDRLIGTRIAVANAEIRVPLFGSRQFGLIHTSFLPIDLAAFVDAGTAWTSSESVDLRFDRNTADRVPVFSAGLATRINVLGFAVAEIFYARPFQRPTKSGVWGVQLVPGW